MLIRAAFLIATLFFCIPSVMAAENADEDSPNSKSKVYHLGENVELTSAVKFQYARPRIVIKTVFPELFSEAQNEGINESVIEFNELISELLAAKIEQFKNEVVQNQPTDKNLPKIALKNDLYTDFAASYVQSGKLPIISVRFNFQGNIAGQARAYHHHDTLNFDLKNQEELELADLFKPDSQYLLVISAYTKEVLNKRQFSNKDLVEQGTAPTLENFKHWNIKPNGILFTFDENQVAPYIDGAQTVLVPFTVLSDLIGDDSPIAGCIKHKSRCSQSNLLTGGFIDEASNHRSRRVDPLHGLFNPALSQR